MAHRHNSLMVSRRSTGLFENDAEELAAIPLSAFGIIDHGEGASRLSGRLLDYSTSVNTIPEPPTTGPTSASNAWTRHLSEMSPREKQLFLNHSKGDLNQYLSDVESICQKQGDKSRALKIAKLFQLWFNTANLYVPIAKTMIQADPSSSALVLGGIMCVMSINNRFAEFPQQITDMLAYMGEKASLLTKYASEVYQNDDFMQSAIVEVFADILDFCRLALPLFMKKDGKERGSAYMFAKSMITSYHGHFEKVLKKFEKDLESFEHKATLCERLEEKAARKEQRSFQALQADVSIYEMGQMMQLNAEQRFFHQSQISAITSSHSIMAFQHRSWEVSEALRRKHEAEREQEIMRNKIIAWLEKSSIKVQEDQNKKVRHRVKETGTWIIEHDSYVGWKESVGAQLLWVHGKRGCGKSFLTSAVVQDLRAVCESADNLKQSAEEKYAYAFIYCDSRETDKHDLEKLFCSLLKQLCEQLPRPTIDPYLRRQYKIYDGSRSLDLEEIQKALDSLIGQFKQTYLVIDGLDELRILGVDEFLQQCQYFRNLTKSHGNGSTAKLIAFSRPEYLHIEQAFADCPQLQINDLTNHGDIEKFISKKMTSIEQYFDHNPALIVDAKHTLRVGAEGVFLWVDRAINTLQGARTAPELRQRLKDLPPDLDNEYANSLAKIAKKSNIALKALFWITNAKRALKHRELLEALAVSPGMTEISPDDRISAKMDFCTECDNLIVFDRDRETYQLLHSSVKDYLTEEHTGNKVPEQYCVLQRNADRVLGETCLAYLSFNQFNKGVPPDLEDLKQMTLANPFLEYASIYWGRHVASVRDENLCDLAKSFIIIPERRNLSMAFMIMGIDETSPVFSGPSNPLHILAMFNLVEVAKSFDDLHSYQNQVDGCFFTPLDYALICRSREMCNKLLNDLAERGFSIEKLAYRCLPIHAAATQNWDEVARKLIDMGCDAEIRYGDEEATAFHRAAIADSRDVLEVLLEKRINMNATQIEGSTPLLLACMGDHTDFAKRLIEADADVNSAGWYGTTPLHHAVNNGQLEIVQTLLDKNADINAMCAREWDLSTSLHLAAEQKQNDVLKYLLDRKAEVEKIDLHGYTALHICAAQGNTECFEALLRYDAKIDLRTKDGYTVMHLAGRCGHKNVLELIFKATPDRFAELVNSTDNNNNTVLDYAVGGWHLEIAKYLMDHGASCEKTTNNSITPLYVAISDGNVEMIKMFLKSDHLLVCPKEVGGAPVLHTLAYIGARHPALNELIPMFLAEAIDPEAEDHAGQRAIHIAMAFGNIEFADILLENNPDLSLDALTTLEQSPMHIAAATGNVKTVEWLINHDVLPHRMEKTRNGCLPIHFSAWDGHIEVLKLLLSPENVNEPDHKGRTALFGASVGGHYDIVEYLLESGADPDIADENNYTPLMVSIHKYHVRVAHLLLDRGASPHSENAKHDTALHKAVRIGNESLVRRLLEMQSDPLHTNKYDESPFTFALTCKNPEILRIFVEEENVDGWQRSTKCDDTCLQLLASFGDEERLEKYKSYLSIRDAESVDDLGRNALWYAASNGHAHSFSYLLDLGVKLQAPKESPTSPLHEAAKNGFIDSVAALIELQQGQIPIDERRGSNGRTALHLAVLSRNTLSATTLLSAGADPYLRDHLGLNCYDFALAYPSLWQETPLWRISHTRSELGPRLPQLRQLAQALLEKILDQPEVLDSLDEHHRADSLSVLKDILMEVGTGAAIERAIVCYVELGNGHSVDWSCAMCGKIIYEGSKWIFCHASNVSLCNTCYCDHKMADGSIANEISLVETLERLENELLLVRKALEPYFELGMKFVVDVCRLVDPIRMYLDQKNDEYEGWAEKCNAKDMFDERKLIGLRFLEWLQKADKVLTEFRGDEYSWSDTFNPATWEASTKAQVSGNVDLEYHQELDILEALEQSLTTFFRDNRTDKENQRALLGGSCPIEIPELEKAKDNQKLCFGDDKRIQRAWLLELKQWLDELETVTTSTEQAFLSQSEINGEDEVVAIEASKRDLGDKRTPGAPAHSVSTVSEGLLSQAGEADIGPKAIKFGEIDDNNTAEPSNAGLDRGQQARENQKSEPLAEIARVFVLDCTEIIERQLPLSEPQLLNGRMKNVTRQIRNVMQGKVSIENDLKDDQGQDDDHPHIPETTEPLTHPVAGASRIQPAESAVDMTFSDDARDLQLAHRALRIMFFFDAVWRLTQAILCGKIDGSTIVHRVLAVIDDDESSTDTGERSH